MLVDIAPIKKNPIISHISLSMKIKDENPCPDFTISVSGSKGSKFKLSNNINYRGLNK